VRETVVFLQLRGGRSAAVVGTLVAFAIVTAETTSASTTAMPPPPAAATALKAIVTAEVAAVFTARLTFTRAAIVAATFAAEVTAVLASTAPATATAALLPAVMSASSLTIVFAGGRRCDGLLRHCWLAAKQTFQPTKKTTRFCLHWSRGGRRWTWLKRTLFARFTRRAIVPIVARFATRFSRAVVAPEVVRPVVPAWRVRPLVIGTRLR